MSRLATVSIAQDSLSMPSEVDLAMQDSISDLGSPHPRSLYPVDAGGRGAYRSFVPYRYAGKTRRWEPGADRGSSSRPRSQLDSMIRPYRKKPGQRDLKAMQHSHWNPVRPIPLCPTPCVG